MLLPPGWDVPEHLPPGITVAPAADPMSAAELVAERVGAEVVEGIGAVEAALARHASRRRARRTIDEAAEASRLATTLEGSDPGADRALLASVDELRARAAAGRDARGRLAELAILEDRLAMTPGGDVDPDHVRVAAADLVHARASAEAAAAAVGRRPVVTPVEIELLRARSLAGDAEAGAASLAESADGGRTRVARSVAVVSGVAALLAASTVLPVEAVSALPIGAAALSASGERKRRRLAVRAAADAQAAHAEAQRTQAMTSRTVAEAVAWARRAAAAEAAAAARDEAEVAWIELVGDGLDVTEAATIAEAASARRALVREVEAARAVSGDLLDLVAAGQEAERRLAEVPGAEAREETRRELARLLHGRRLERLQSDAEAARALATEPARPLVLCDPFSHAGRGRRRALLRELDRAYDVAIAVVTADADALAWAEARANGAPAWQAEAVAAGN